MYEQCSPAQVQWIIVQLQLGFSPAQIGAKVGRRRPGGWHAIRAFMAAVHCEQQLGRIAAVFARAGEDL
jgi:hypothetical protein